MDRGVRVSRMVRLLVAALALLTVLTPFASVDVSATSSLRWLYGSGSATGGRPIHLRIELTEAAPAGGAVVTLTSNNPAIPVPASTKIPAGLVEKTISVATVSVRVDTSVQVTATYRGVSKSRRVLVKAPVLSGLYVQGTIRAGGLGRVTVRLSGPAPVGGVTLNVRSSRPSILSLPGDFMINAGQTSKTFRVPAAMVPYDIFMNVTARFDGRKIIEPTIHRNYSILTPTATPTETGTATETATLIPTNTVTSTPTASPTATHTETPAPTVTNTATPDPTATSSATESPTNTPTATEAATETTTPTETQAPTDTPTSSPTVTETFTPIPTDTPDPTATPTASATNSPLPTDTPSATATITPLPTDTATPIPTSTATPTETATHTATPTSTATETATPEPTSTPTETATNTPLPTDTPTPTPSNTAVPTATDTVTPTATVTATATDTPTATATSTPSPPEFSFTIADSTLVVGQSTSVQACWTNPSTGASVAPTYMYASPFAGSTGTTFVLLPNMNGYQTVQMTAQSPCASIDLAANQVGTAVATLEYWNGSGSAFFYSGTIWVTAAFATTDLSAAPRSVPASSMTSLARDAERRLTSID